MSWNPFAKKPDPTDERAGAAAGADSAGTGAPASSGPPTDSTDPLILSPEIKEQHQLLREANGLRYERIELSSSNDGGAAFLRISMPDEDERTAALRALWLALGEETTGFRDLLVKDDVALCAAFDLPRATLAELPALLAGGAVYLRPADLLSMLKQCCRALAAIQAECGWVLPAPEAGDFSLSWAPLLRGRSGEQGVQLWRCGILHWDKLSSDSEAHSARALLSFFAAALAILHERAQLSGVAYVSAQCQVLIDRVHALTGESELSYSTLADWAAAYLRRPLELHGATDTGMRRQHNEDAYLLLQLDQHSNVGAGFSIAAIADGMGGHASGEVASSLALDLLRIQLQQTVLPPRTQAGDPGQLPGALRGIIPGISRILSERAAMDAQLGGMGTTLIGLARWQASSTVDSAAGSTSSVLFWCGDSRAYLCGPSGLTRLSLDHSYVQDLVEAGSIDREEAFSHPQKNVITRCLGGGGNNSEPDLLPYSPGPGEVLLLCSDGLSDALRDSEIWEVVRNSRALDSGFAAGAAGLASELIAAANAAGGPDNITVLLVAAGA